MTVSKTGALKLADYTNKIWGVSTMARENRRKNKLARRLWEIDFLNEEEQLGRMLHGPTLRQSMAESPMLGWLSCRLLPLHF